MSNGSLTWDVLRDTIQTVINTTTPIWYGTSDMIEQGKVIASLESEPPFIIVNPDDVRLLPEGARHLRGYRPTRAEMAKDAERWLDEQLNQPVEYAKSEPFTMRPRWFLRGWVPPEG